MSDTQTTSYDVTWACVEADFHVASRDGNFLGFIDRRGDADFVACDEHSRRIGRYTDMLSAMDAVLSASSLSRGATQ